MRDFGRLGHIGGNLLAGTAHTVKLRIQVSCRIEFPACFSSLFQHVQVSRKRRCLTGFEGFRLY